MEQKQHSSKKPLMVVGAIDAVLLLASARPVPDEFAGFLEGEGSRCSRSASASRCRTDLAMHGALSSSEPAVGAHAAVPDQLQISPDVVIGTASKVDDQATFDLIVRGRGWLSIMCSAIVVDDLFLFASVTFAREEQIVKPF
jgi:hypothetical protein